MDFPTKYIGKGAYSIVYAWGNVAIKKYDMGNFDSATREIAFIQSCNHKNIIRLHKVVFDQKIISFEMDRHQTTLRKCIELRTLSPDGCVLLMQDLAAGLVHMHSRGIIHCDIKPPNLLVNKDPLSLIICDMGISQMADDRKHSHNIQTVNYRAPEVDFYDTTYERLTPKVDVWSAGAVIMEMITGDYFNNYHEYDDTSHSLCEILGKGKLGSREERLKILDQIDQEEMDRFLRAKCSQSSIRNSKPFDKIIVAAVMCLIPNVAHRADATQLAVHLGGTFADAKRIKQKSIPIDETKCAENIGAGILEYISTDCLMLAEKIFRSYTAATHTACIDCVNDVCKKYDKIRYACIYIAENIYRGSGTKIHAAVLARFGARPLETEVAKILIHYNGHVIRAKK